MPIDYLSLLSDPNAAIGKFICCLVLNETLPPAVSVVMDFLKPRQVPIQFRDMVQMWQNRNSGLVEDVRQEILATLASRIGEVLNDTSTK